MPALSVIDEALSDADRAFGYRFGCEGVVNAETARDMLGGISERTMFRRIAENKLRNGREGGRIVICRRSLMNYIASLEK